MAAIECLNKIVQYLNRTINQRLTPAINFVGQMVLLLMVLLISLDVILRNAFNSPLKGSVELTEILMVIVVFFAVAQTASKNQHVNVELMISRFSYRIRAVFLSITNFLCIGLLSLAIWQSVMLAISFLHNKATTAVLLVPLFPFALVVSIGCTFFALVTLIRFLESVLMALKSS